MTDMVSSPAAPPSVPAPVQKTERDESSFQPWKNRSARQKLAFCLGALWTIYIILSLCKVFFLLGIVIYPVAHRAICAGALVSLALLIVPARKGHQNGPLGSALEAVLILWTLAACGYVVWNADTLIYEWGDANWWQMILAGGFTVALMEAVRRTSGLAPVILSLGAFFYFVYSDLFPGFLMSTGFTYAGATGWMFLSGEGYWGGIIAVAASTVPGFILFGCILQATGASNFFSDLARACLGAYRGGPAKTAVLSSMFFGSLSGSVAANVATTGQITIPMMKKNGFSSELAGAVEAVASTGGMFTPPIMGATAFLVADFLSVSYWTVCAAAFLPAVLYYGTLLTQVDIEALSVGASGEPRENLPRVRDVLREGWYYIPPFAVLVVCMGVLKWSAESSIVYTLLALVLCTALSPGTRLTYRRFLDVLEGTAKGMVMVIPLCAAIGILVGAMTVTGAGQNLSNELGELAGGNIYLLLAMSGLASFVLGMGMSSIACYLLTVTMLAPAIVGSGVEPIAVHMFLFYYGALSFITPPVAIAAFVASGISGGDPSRTGALALRMGIAGFLVPWAFVVYPALLFVGPLWETALVFAASFAGLIAISGGTMGYLLIPLRQWERAALLAGGAGIFIPLPDTIQYSVLAVILAVMGLLFLRMRHAAARGTV